MNERYIVLNKLGDWFDLTEPMYQKREGFISFHQMEQELISTMSQKNSN